LGRATEQKRHKALHGLYHALIANMVKGVSQGYRTEQELVGVGFRAAAKGQMLELSLGYSHNISFELPKEIKLVTATEKGQNPKVILECADKHLIGLVAAKPMRCLSAHSRITFGFCPFTVAVTNLISLGN